jgi:predicted transposase/invertase (TIGR01784 family)
MAMGGRSKTQDAAARFGLAGKHTARNSPIMPEESLHQPHDKLFKSAFGEPSTAAAFLRWEIPPALSSAIDWDNLRLEPGSFVDSHYRQSESDLLFSAPSSTSECFVYLLFEHQLAPDPWIALRLLRYQVRIWETWRKNHPKRERLPVILPVVLAQNAEVWKISPQFSTLLDIPEPLAAELSGMVPDFTFRLIQLADMEFEAIRGTPAGILTLRVMKAERLEKLLEDIVWDEALFLRVPQEIIELLIRYILDADVDKAAFDRKVGTVTNSAIQSTAMTLAQQYRQEGRQEGQILAQQRAVIEALEIRFERIPQGLREEIGHIADPARLPALHRAAIQAASLEEFSRSL